MAVVAAALVLLGTSHCTNAQASSAPSGLENGATHLCLDDSQQFGLRTFGCNQASYDNGYQRWFTTRYPVQYENAATGLCLDYSERYQLRMFVCANPLTEYQSWNDIALAYGGGQLENTVTDDPQHPQLCLDDSQQFGLRMYDCNQASYDNGYQHWYHIIWG